MRVVFDIKPLQVHREHTVSAAGQGVCIDPRRDVLVQISEQARIGSGAWEVRRGPSAG